jgi:hypothetical protein
MHIGRLEEETSGATAARDPVVALPFRGRAESYQLLGVGRWEAARRLCEPRGLCPVRCGDEGWALVQLSLMKWKQSPVGPYWASFMGIAVGPEAPGPRTTSPRLPGGAAVLSAFLGAPKVLFAPAYVVGDVRGVPPGSASRSRAFGREALGIEKSPAAFTITRTLRASHVHVLERRPGPDGRLLTSGYALTLSNQPARLPLGLSRLPISPRLLMARGLVTESLRALVEPEVKGAFVFPSPAGSQGVVHVGTRFKSRPRLIDLSGDGRASFSPIVVDRPAPPNALGALLDEIDFSPRVLMWDPDLAGTIVGPAPSLQAAVA